MKKRYYTILGIILVCAICTNLNKNFLTINRDLTMMYIHLAEKCTNVKMYDLSNFYYKVAMKISTKPTIWLDYNIAKNIINQQWNAPLTPHKKAKLKEAISHLDIEIKKYSTNADINAHYAYAYDLLEDYDKAIEYYEKCVAKIPKWEYGLTRLANLYSLVKFDYKKALEYVDRALEVAKDKHNLMFRKAYILSGLERYNEAIAIYKEYIEEEPNAVWALVNISECELTVKDYENALKHIEQGLKYNSTSAYLLKNKVAILIHENKFDEAKEIIRKINRYKNNGYMVYFNLAMIEKKQGNLVKAEELLKKSKQNAKEYYDKFCEKNYDLSDMDGNCRNRYEFLEHFDKTVNDSWEIMK